MLKVELFGSAADHSLIFFGGVVDPLSSATALLDTRKGKGIGYLKQDLYLGLQRGGTFSETFQLCLGNFVNKPRFKLTRNYMGIFGKLWELFGKCIKLSYINTFF